MARPVYLDHNATTPIFPEVVEAIRTCWDEPYLNPASQHAFGRRARRALEDARDRVAEILGANPSGPTPDRVVFTSGGTEANHFAVLGALPPQKTLQPLTSPPQHLIISAIEHPSIAALADRLAASGWQVDRLGVDRRGVIRIEDLRRMLRPDTRLVAAMLANNETGVIQPVAELAAVCRDHAVPLHTDAAQAAGKLPLSFRQLGATTMSVAAHKFGGPLGIGALVVRGEASLSPQLVGGFQQFGLRAGTESVALAVGMCRALELWEANRAAWSERLSSLRNRLEGAIRSGATSCEVEILGEQAERLPNTSNIAFRGLDRQALFVALDQAGVACSTGSACASGSSEPSPVLRAMGCDEGLISGALRFSLGRATTRHDIDQAGDRIIRICNDLGRRQGG